MAPPSLAPYLVVRFGPDASGPVVDALIDTGANWTVLGSRDALLLLGRQYLEIDFDHAPGRVDLAGFFQGDASAIIRPMEIWLRDVDGAEFSISLQVADLRAVAEDAWAAWQLVDSVVVGAGCVGVV